MNKQEITRRLANTRLDIHERETLNQLLHYLVAEGLNQTASSSNKPKPKYTRKPKLRVIDSSDKPKKK